MRAIARMRLTHLLHCLSKCCLQHDLMPMSATSSAVAPVTGCATASLCGLLARPRRAILVRDSNAVRQVLSDPHQVEGKGQHPLPPPPASWRREARAVAAPCSSLLGSCSCFCYCCWVSGCMHGDRLCVIDFAV